MSSGGLDVRTSFWSPLHDLEAEGNGTALHGDPPLLLVFTTVEVSDFPSHPRRDYTVGGQERIHHSRFAMIDMTDGGDIPHIYGFSGSHACKEIARELM